MSLAVAPALVVRGRVVDADGAPVADAWVELRPVVAGVAAGPDPAAGSATGPDGCFELPPVAPGSFAVGVDSAGRPSLELDRVTLDPAATDPELALTLPRGAAVEGVVVPWRAGRRAEVVFVHARGAERRVAVGDDGRFALRGLTPGRHAVHVARTDPSPAAYVADRLRAAGAGAAVELRDGALHDLEVEDVAAAMATVRVQLVGALAPEELRVSAHREDLPLPFDGGALFEAAPDALGRAALEGLPPGRWRLEVRDRDGEPAGRATVDLGRGEVRELQVDVGK